MPKLGIEFNVPLSLLIRGDGTKEKLIAIAYLRGQGKSYAGPVREALAQYVENYVQGLKPAERKAYDEILQTVMTSAKLKSQIKSDSQGG